MDLRISGKTAVVTGGSKGIGRLLVSHLLQEGVAVLFCARNQDLVDQTVDDLKDIGPQVVGFVGDVNEEDFLKFFVESSAEALGGIDLAVANVGGMSGGQLLDSTSTDWSSTYHSNVGHAVSLARAVVPSMRGRGAGSIVFVSSISGWKPAPTLQYGASKAALIYAAQALGRHLGRYNIRVNAVSPGSILAEGGPWAQWRDEDPTGFESFVAREFPNGRLARPEEVADTILYVLSNRASWISGTNIAVDGAQERPSATPW